MDGKIIYKNSDLKTAHPAESKKCLTDKGDAIIGLQGKKYLALLNGVKNAAPNPPLVIASNII